MANTILTDGENTLRLIFADGEIEISIFVTGETQKEESSEIENEESSEIKSDESSEIKSDESSEIKSGESSDNSATQISDNTGTPDTGESNPFFIIPIFAVSGLIAVVASKKKSRKNTF